MFHAYVRNHPTCPRHSSAALLVPPSSYAWRGEGITLANLLAAVEEALAADPDVPKQDAVACFVDVFVCAQHRGKRPGSGTCPNATDVGKFEEVIDACPRLVLYATPLMQPKVMTRVWCLFEIMSAMKRGRPVLIALGEAAHVTSNL